MGTVDSAIIGGLNEFASTVGDLLASDFISVYGALDPKIETHFLTQ